MSRFRYNKPYVDWKAYHTKKRKLVSDMFGGIDQSVLDLFLNLDSVALEKLFTAYRAEYASSATSYARRTYSKWQSGEVNPSGQTLIRLVSILPPLLPFGAKCELLRTLRERSRKKEIHNLTVDTVTWMETIVPLVSRIVSRAYTTELPEHVERRLDWLSSGDMQAAKAILKAAEAHEGKNAAAFLRSEFRTIDLALSSLGRRGKIKHVIELPYGTINLTIKRRRRMDKDEKLSVVPKAGDRSLFRPTTEDIFDSAFENLDEGQVRSVSEKAAEEGMRLVAEKRRGEQKTQSAQQAIEGFIENANQMDKASLGRDYSMSGSYESASGVTNIQVSRNKSTIAIVIVVVIGIISILYFLTRR